MDQNTKRQAKKQLQKQRRKKIQNRIIAILGSIVVFCTTYALILPAITMTDNVFCGKEEHKHTDECYSSELICGYSTEAVNADSHTHTESCYVTEKSLVCTLEETQGHTHIESCATREKNLVCGQEESPGHTHTDSCISKETVLTCTLAESETHTHDSNCYTENATYICNQTESAGHVHSDSCYTENIVYTCNQEESEAHTHGEGCWSEKEILNCEQATKDVGHEHSESCYETGSLKCTLEEHTHELACFSNPDADVETAEDWEKTLPDELSGKWREDVLAIAESQLGYQESEENYIVTEDGEKKGYTRYGDWYGDSYGHWCAMFVSFCLDYAGVEGIPLNSNCQNWIETLSQTEYNLYYENGEYVPEPADLIFFEWDSGVSKENSKADHVGLVVEVIPETEDESAKVKTIEGNASDCVMYHTYELDDTSILGYGKLPSAPLTEEEQAEVDNVIALIDALPSADEIDAKLLAYEEAEDMEGYEAYFKEVMVQAQNAYSAYQALSPDLQEHVTNIDKLMDLSWLWSMAVMNVTDSIVVKKVNYYKDSSEPAIVPTLVYNAAVSSLDYGGFEYWTAVIVEKQEDGYLYIKEIVPSGGSEDKSALKAETADGFVLLIYSGDMQISAVEGDMVSIDFDYKSVTGYNSSADGYGTVRFGTLKADKNNSNLTIIQGADTSKLIEVNLYDYNDEVNGPYNMDNNYPGFQQDNGTTNSFTQLDKYTFNFGNNITSNLDAGIAGLTVNSGTNINATTSNYGDTDYGLANLPISGMMLDTLQNGYPALKYNNLSLKYLFTDNSGYATKMNENSINGLFLYDPETGAYTFDSRKNHAQFNADTDTFTLYEQVISSNFMMYPFGNFLPFNDIVTTCKQTSEIDRDYIESIAASALYKYNAGMGSEYATLATNLTQFISLMDKKYPNGWASADAINEYFQVAGLSASFTQEDDLLKKVYSIDYDEATNFFFGMEMKMNFMQPKSGLTGPKGDQEMVFYFTGDDDVWIYIDGKMFLDLSGIHRHVGGEIDFVKGEVRYYYLDTATGEVSTEPYKTVTFAEILGSTDGLNAKGTFEDYSMHTFNFYYMERGAGSGVCRMNFNFPLIQENSISVTKEMSTDSEVGELLGDPNFKFQILKANGTEESDRTEEPFIGTGTSYDIYDEHGNYIGTGITDASGVFTIKPGQTAVFSNIDSDSGYYYVRELLDEAYFEQYGEVTVDGVVTLTDKYEGGTTQIGTENFVGIESSIKNIAEVHATAFDYKNRITTNKLGSLEIEKQLIAGTDTEVASEFDFFVTLDDIPISVGTEYQVGEEIRTVTEEGIVTVPAGSKAVISRIIAGSRFSVQETSESAEGYTVTYSGSEGVITDGDKATGTVGVNALVTVQVQNIIDGMDVVVSGQKIIKNPDGNEHTVTFRLEQVTDATGTELVADGTSMTSDVVVTDTSEFQFKLSYLVGDITSIPKAYYYKITEIVGENSDSQYLMDESVYIVEVTISKNEEDKLLASVTKRWRDGKEISDDENLTFTNTLLSDLMISKVVEGTDNGGEFTFEIELKTGEESVTGTFNAGDDTIKFDDKGKATVALQAGETITIEGIPYGATWTVTEMNNEEYVVYHAVSGSEQVKGESVDGVIGNKGENSVVFTNVMKYSLPETGGIGTDFYIIGGLLLILIVLLINIKRIFERRYI